MLLGLPDSEYRYGLRPPDADTRLETLSPRSITTSDIDEIVSGGETRMSNDIEAVLLSSSVTVTVREKVPVCLGVPVMRPPLSVIRIPLGAPDREYRYGVRPPDADICTGVMALPFVASTLGTVGGGSSGGETRMVNDDVEAVLPSASVTFALTLVKDPVCVGVPVMRPLLEIEILLGAPDREYAYGVRPPDADTGMVMLSPRVIATSDISEIVSGGETRMVNDVESAPLSPSVTFTL